MATDFRKDGDGEMTGFDIAIDALAALSLGAWGFLVAPKRASKAQAAPFVGRTYAHRGLYAADQSVPENSLPAFMRAAEAGYGIELDVQRTLDGRIVVFHDDDMRRACGLEKRVCELTYAELCRIPLFSGAERIPLFSDVLAAVAGCVPLIVELKYCAEWETLCRDTLALLRQAGGDWCVESFHPRIVRWFYKNAPEVLRGQLSEAYRFSRRFLPWHTALMMSRLWTNCLTRPHFVAYRIGPRGLSERLCELLGAVRVRWTMRPADDTAALLHGSDAVIFEHFPDGATPPTRFCPPRKR